MPDPMAARTSSRDDAPNPTRAVSKASHRVPASNDPVEYRGDFEMQLVVARGSAGETMSIRGVLYDAANLPLVHDVVIPQREQQRLANG
jgi:hypothetical protein